MKILMLDIETTPNLAYVWGLFKENIPLARLIEPSNILCYAAKWYENDEIFFDSTFKSSPKRMLKGLHKLISEADVVVHYNGTRFDMPIINSSFIKYGFPPPAPYKQVDLLKVARSQFRFTSNKMDFVSQQLGLGSKRDTTFDLWVGCMKNDPDCWATMEDYNIEDVMILERLYVKMLPWIKNHPNHGIYESVSVCPSCGSSSITKRGFTFTNAGKYQRYNCGECNSWFRARAMEKSDVKTYRAI